MRRKKIGVFIPMVLASVFTVATSSIGVWAQEGDTHALPGMQFVDRLNPAEAEAAYQGLLPGLANGYANSGLVGADYTDWARFTTTPYFSITHSDLTVHVYANEAAETAYSAFGGEEFPVGSIVVKDGMGQTEDGVVPAPMAFMEKMPAGFSSATGDWKFAMITPDGTVVGQTGGPGEESVQFCVACHTAAAGSGDWLYFPPTDKRAAR